MPSIAPDSLPASPDQWWRHWAGCVEDAAAADVLLFRDLSGENQCGGLIEMGAALASGRQLFLVSENWWSVEHHARVRKFKSLEHAVTAIKAMQTGEGARRLAVVSSTRNPG